jgi:alcohol dehydrogenase (cytochrome c)
MTRHLRISLTIAAASLVGVTLAAFAEAPAPKAAQSRTPAAKPTVYSPKLVAQGQPLFAAHCGFCHGRDAMGGEIGPDLTRSSVVAEDVKGDKIGPVVKLGRPDKGMPPISLSESQLQAIVAFLHDARENSGAVLGARRRVADEDLRTGNAAAGKSYFEGAGGCVKCHSATGDLVNVADRLQGLELLQRMLHPRSTGKPPDPAKVTVTLPSGETIAGKLAFRDEFYIAIKDSQGWQRTWPLKSVKVAIDDPLEAHAAQLAKYTDADMHNVLAYLQSLGTGVPVKKPTTAPPAGGPGASANMPPALPPPTGPPALDPSALLKPAKDSWPTYHGDYSGRRHSSLDQITPDNVHQLSLAWSFPSGQPGGIKSTPILVNGILYVTAPDHIWAVDARTGRQIWHYTHPQNTGFHIGHRGAAFSGNTVFLTTPDSFLVALDARNGRVKWKVEIASAKKGYWSTNAPLVIRNHVIVGVSGDFDNLPGILTSVDPESGDTQWVFHSTPPPGTPDSISGGATGGQMWMTGTYDPDLNLLYVGTGNPTPVLNGSVRPGDNKWTGSILALNPDTGKLAWGFQVLPHDTHDWDAAEVPVLVDANFNGQPRKLLLQASRNGYYFVLDRTNGKNLLTIPFAAANWAKGIGPDGVPIPDPDKEPARDGRLVAPSESGGTNYRSPSFDPATGLLIVSALDAYGVYFFKPEHGTYGWAGADYNVQGGVGAIRAIDYQTGKVRWNHEIGGGGGAGVLTTATGIAFTGDARGNALALRTTDGSTLWSAAIGGVGNGPVTYELDGRQYLIVGGGSSLYAFALPEKG